MALLVPDVLVLAAGGTVGEAWMTGVLAGIEAGSGVDLRRVEQLVGTSAGSIVAASLVAGRSPRRPREGADTDLPPADAAPARRGVARALAATAWGATAPLAAPAIALGAPGGALARSLVLARVPDGGRSLADLRAAVDARGPRFDGRLRVVAVDRANGRRVVFGAPGAPDATVGEAVAASCAIPWVFDPVPIGGRTYVDGGVWSPTNLDVAQVGRGTEVLCLNVSASLAQPLASPLGALRAAARASEAIEAQALRRRGARVRTIAPDAAAAEAIGGDLMDASRAGAALAAGYRQGRVLV
jgi:NTE family protein